MSSERGNNNFRSLLSTFQVASGIKATSSPSPEKHAKNKKDEIKNVVESPPPSSKAETFTAAGKDDIIKERLRDIWRTTTIRHSMKQLSTLPKSSLQSNNYNKSQNDHVHIAICMCVVDQVPHEDIWKEWMKPTELHIPSINQTIKVTSELYIHAKSPESITSEWLRSKLISKSFRPNWNDVRIVRAMISLAEHAFHDDKKNSETNNTTQQQQNMTHLVFCTESCIPISTLEETAHSLIVCKKGGINWNQSFVDCYSQKNGTRFDETHCFDILSQTMPPDAIYKALPGWITLCRQHVQNIIIDLPKQLSSTNAVSADKVKDVELWPYFEHVWAPEEVYFPTALSLMGALLSSYHDKDYDASSCPIVHRKSVTWCKWDTHASNHQDRAHPFIYTLQELRQFISKTKEQYGCLFLRKVKQSIPLHEWKNILQINNKNGRHEASSNTTRNNHKKRHHEDDDHFTKATTYTNFPTRFPRRKPKRSHNAYNDSYHDIRRQSNHQKKRFHKNSNFNVSQSTRQFNTDYQNTLNSTISESSSKKAKR